jgi:hypothetical protein
MKSSLADSLVLLLCSIPATGAQPQPQVSPTEGLALVELKRLPPPPEPVDALQPGNLRPIQALCQTGSATSKATTTTSRGHGTDRRTWRGDSPTILLKAVLKAASEVYPTSAATVAIVVLPCRRRSLASSMRQLAR